MKFYEIDGALQEAIVAADKPVRLKIELPINGHFESVFEQDIIEANFFGLKEVAGGTSVRGKVLISNEQGVMSNEATPPGSQVKVSFSLGEGLPFFQRFVFYVDDKGIQDIRGPGRKKLAYIGLRDFSAVLRKTDEAKDWTSPAVFTYSVVCDKTQPHKSLVHGIAQRAGLAAGDIDCATIPVTLPYVKLTKNIWSELSSLATAYRCHLECPVEKPLVFAHSPYQSEPLAENEFSYTFTGNDIFYLRKTAKTDYYRNTVRLKVNMPVVLERQEIWRYEDQPVFYDELLQEYFPFKQPLVRVIQISKYNAPYMIRTFSDSKKNVVYADEIDTQEEAESRLQFEGGDFHYTYYDVTSHSDKAIITLRTNSDGDLYKAAIFGRPIVIIQNCSCFMRNEEAVAAYGTKALNVTGAYYSEYAINGKPGTKVPHYEDWVIRELAERVQKRREFTVKTHRALFHARVGANIKLKIKNEELTGTINAFALRYKRDKAFVASFRITEGGNNAE
jgi:hypothetical protein